MYRTALFHHLPISRLRVGLIQALGGSVEYITAGELATLLAVLWLPIFVLAALPQWRSLSARRNAVAWLGAALLVEVLLAFGLWLSPLHQYFPSLDFLGSLAIVSIPLQAATLAAIAVTAVIWGLGRRGLRSAP